jgi:hypothetical protein
VLRLYRVKLPNTSDAGLMSELEIETLLNPPPDA